MVHDGVHVGTVEIGLNLNSGVFEALVAGSDRQVEFYTFPELEIGTFSAGDESVRRLAATFDSDQLLSAEDFARAARGELEPTDIEIGGSPYRRAFAIINDFAGAEVGLAHILVPLQGYAQVSARMNIMAAIAGAVALLVGAIAAWFFGGRISAALNDLVRKMHGLADGDTSIDFKGAIEKRGEIGHMARALEVFQVGMIEKERLREEEATTRAAVEKLKEDQRQQAEEQRVAEAERDRKQRERDEKESAEREERQRQRAEDMAAREAEQTAVVSALAEGLRSLARGDLRARLDSPFSQGYEQVRQDFNEMAEKLAGLIRSIAGTSDNVAGGSNEISSSAENLSRRTEQTAATLEETAAALNELTASVTSAAEGARQADDIVRTTKRSAEASSSVVSEAVDAVTQIESSSQKITSIISVIDDIAFQTNLLALNAGVEAARAGDAGRGFAVVASEVRALAQRSSEAASEINALISESSEQVKRGVSLVGEAGNALQSILEQVSEISSHVTDIATSSGEQSTGINEINTAVTQIDQATQQNAAMFEEMFAASTVLSQAASNLQEDVGQFQVSEKTASEGQVGWDRLATDHDISQRAAVKTPKSAHHTGQRQKVAAVAGGQPAMEEGWDEF